MPNPFETRPNRIESDVTLPQQYEGWPSEGWPQEEFPNYYGFFKDRGKLGYLGKYPKSMIDPTKAETQERHKGTPITPFSLTKQLDNGISYFENHCDKIDWIEILDNALLFDPYDRTKFDILVTSLS